MGYFKLHRNYIFPFFIIFCGIVLRLIWVEDMEWKFDEYVMHLFSEKFNLEGIIPNVGMKSGVKVPRALR